MSISEERKYHFGRKMRELERKFLWHGDHLRGPLLCRLRTISCLEEVGSYQRMQASVSVGALGILGFLLFAIDLQGRGSLFYSLDRSWRLRIDLDFGDC